LRISSTGKQGDHFITQAEGTPFTNAIHHTGHLEPHDVADPRRWRIVSLSLEKIGAIHTSSAYGNAYMPRGWLWVINLS
jgi:hypothetical protein